VTPPAPLAASSLRALARRPLPAAPVAEERCDVCAQLVPEGHRHLLDPPADAVLCACQACALLFAGGGAREDATAGVRAAGGPRYRLIPRRRIRLGGPVIDALTWAALGVPVTLAFFVRGVPPVSDGVTAGYPSALGTTRSTVTPDAWDLLTARHPDLAALAPGTEALLVDRAGHRPDEQWIVPLDDCYRLVALLRTQWKGFTGGAEAAQLVRQFFAGLVATESSAQSPGSPGGERTRHG
jgi:hypothetical protein